MQRGLRWIPSYRLTLLGDETVRVELQATLINDLADLEDVTTHLVVGVLRFEFAHTIDPIALRAALAPLGPYFQTGNTGRVLSNALVAQTALMSERPRVPIGVGTSSAPSVEVSGVDRAEDHFLFLLEHVTLGLGERMTTPLVQADLPVESLYKLNLPIEPPSGVSQRPQSIAQQRQIAELMSQPKARHTLRISNTSAFPLTTAPAFIIQEDGFPLAQGMMTYCPIGGVVDLEVTDAVDIQVRVEHEALGRTPEDLTIGNQRFVRVTNISRGVVTNRKPHLVRLEITAYVFGQVDETDQRGRSKKVSFFMEPALRLESAGAWWRNWMWPDWWARLNGASRVDWTVEIKSGESTEFHWNWSYLSQ